MTPSLKIKPAMVVPVLTALGAGKPWLDMKLFLDWETVVIVTF
jgi:hypothetical protein